MEKSSFDWKYSDFSVWLQCADQQNGKGKGSGIYDCGGRRDAGGAVEYSGGKEKGEL